MEPIIRKLPAKMPPAPALVRVAGYARVSSGKEAMLDSLSAQVSYYSGLIQNHPGWAYVGVFMDEAYTGTKDARPGFQQLLAVCREGKVDMIITKSISRFSRNTVTLLSTIRELKSLGVDVFFEREGIHTNSGDGELMLSILASYAQEESLSVSENCKWRIRNGFKRGNARCLAFYGFTVKAGELRPLPKEAKVIREIFDLASSGLGKRAIKRRLDELGYEPPVGEVWQESTVAYILRNEKYVGDMLLQKTFVMDHLTKHKRRNKGELPRIYVTGCHDPIVERETFERVQALIQSRAAKYNPEPSTPSGYAFTGMLVCAGCGKRYQRKIANCGSKYAKPVWVCASKKLNGRHDCCAVQIPEEILTEVTADALGMDRLDEAGFRAKVFHIMAEKQTLVYELRDGRRIERTWQNRSRAWSDEAKAAARQRYEDRRMNL